MLTFLKYDTAQGPFKGHEVSTNGDKLVVDGKSITVYAQKDPSELPWGTLGVDVVLESTGLFTSAEKAGLHIKAGAKKVVVSAPATGEGVKTVVYNVNDNILDGTETIVSAASCTTNALAPLAKVLDDNFGIVKGFMTTVHAYTNDQSLMDQPHKKGFMSRRGRAAASSIIPSSTGAAAIGIVLPQLKGKLDGTALRVPTITGSIVDLTVELGKEVTLAEIDAAFKAAANESLQYQPDPIVSADVIGSHFGSIYDANTTQILKTDAKFKIGWVGMIMKYMLNLSDKLIKIANLTK